MSNSKSGGLTVTALIAMIFTTIFGFSNVPTAYMMMGYAAIPWYILAGLLFFIPYALMVGEYGMAFRGRKGGIFVWMSESVNMKYGFMGIFMWYTAFIIYFVNVSTVFFMKISAFIFGSDTTSTWSIFGLNSTQTIGILAVLLIIAITFLSSRGVKSVAWIAKIGGTAIVTMQIIVLVGSILILICNHGQFQQGMSFSNFTTSPNPSYASGLSMLSFVTMAISAYGGIEATGGLVDKAESSKKIPKAIAGAAIAITVCYAVMIFCLGVFVNWERDLNIDGVNLANVQYVVMKYLGYQLGLGLGVSESAALTMGSWFTRFYGLACTLGILGSITVFFYGPLTQLMEGTPKEIWPEWMYQKDEKTGIPVHAMIVQSAIICVFILAISFGGTTVNSFWNLIILMTNVAMTIPYIFVAGGFPFFKKNSAIEKPVCMIRSQGLANVLTVIVCAMVGFANVFTIISPALEGDITSTVLQIAGPTLFALTGLLLYRRYEKKGVKK